jgi:hypothetical protein
MCLLNFVTSGEQILMGKVATNKANGFSFGAGGAKNEIFGTHALRRRAKSSESWPKKAKIDLDAHAELILFCFAEKVGPRDFPLADEIAEKWNFSKK